MKYKKADVQTLRNLIIAAVVILVLFAIFIGVYEWLNDLKGISQCRFDVLMSSSLRVEDVSIADIDLDCPREDFKVEVDDVRDYQGKVTKRAVMSFIAEQFRRCWFKFGEGANPFRGEIMAKLLNDLKQSCAFCSYVTFDSDVLDELYKNEKVKTIPIQEFKDFFRSQTYPGSDKTYEEYFQRSGYSVDKIMALMEHQLRVRDLDLSQDFYVVYSFTNPGYMQTLFSSDERKPSMFIFQKKDIKDSGCNVLLN